MKNTDQKKLDTLEDALVLITESKEHDLVSHWTKSNKLSNFSEKDSIEAYDKNIAEHEKDLNNIIND